jgi:carboxypeptidase Q
MMTRRALALCLLLSLLSFVTLLAAANPAVTGDEADLQTIHRIRAEAFNNSQVMNHLFFLTDVHGPRLTGSPELKTAGEWVVNTVKGWGAEKATLERWGPFGRGWTYSKYDVALVKPTYAPLIGFPLAWTPGTNGKMTGELVLAPIQEKADFEKYQGKLQGKIVLLDLPRGLALETDPSSRRYTDSELANLENAMIPAPRSPVDLPRAGGQPDWEGRSRFRNERNEFLAKEGAAGVITIGMGTPQSASHRSQNGTVFAAAGGSWKKDDPVPPPMVALTPEHYNRLVRLVAGKQPVEVSMEIDARFLDDDLDSFTVVAEIPGTTRKSEVVMLGGHIDSWHGGTGATDNASGCAVAMEAFRILKTLNLKMDRTVRLALWTGEEQGLLGSRAYVKEHFADPETMQLKPEHAQLAAYFNLDNGAGKIRGIYLQGNDMLRETFTRWMAPFRDTGATTVTIRNTSGTDHLAFDAVGLPGFQFIQDPLEYMSRTHHSNMDVYDRVQPQDLMQSAAVMASFVYHTATRPEMLPRKPLPKPRPARTSPDGAPQRPSE